MKNPQVPANRTWRVTFTLALPEGNRSIFDVVQAPTKHLALWSARERMFGAFMMRAPNVIKETVGVVRKRNMCRGGGR